MDCFTEHINLPPENVLAAKKNENKYKLSDNRRSRWSSLVSLLYKPLQYIGIVSMPYSLLYTKKTKRTREKEREKNKIRRSKSLASYCDNARTFRPARSPLAGLAGLFNATQIRHSVGVYRQ